MTEKQLRDKYVNTAISYLGASEGSSKHREIVDTYNTIVPLPRGYKLTYSDDWCAGFVSAMAQICGFTGIIFAECSCTRMTALFNAVGGVQSARFSPQRGDIIMYDWNPSAGDGCDHVGIVVSNDGSTLSVIEGNKNNKVEYRTVSLSSANIYCYCCPNYASLASGEEPIEPPDVISGNRFLTMNEMKNNAAYIWWYLSQRGWTANAVAGMLGNMQVESTINPAIWERLDLGNTSGGFGLVQWTPATKLIEWANSNNREYQDMNTQLDRIEWELANGVQYYPTDNYPETFAQFKTSTKDPSYLGMAFLANYERPADPDQPARGTNATFWYNYITLDFTKKKSRKGLSLLLMWAATRR